MQVPDPVNYVGGGRHLELPQRRLESWHNLRCLVPSCTGPLQHSLDTVTLQHQRIQGCNPGIANRACARCGSCDDMPARSPQFTSHSQDQQFTPSSLPVETPRVLVPHWIVQNTRDLVCMRLISSKSAQTTARNLFEKVLPCNYCRSSALGCTLEEPLNRGNLQDHGHTNLGIETCPAEVLADFCTSSTCGDTLKTEKGWVALEARAGVRAAYASLIICSLFNLRSVSSFI